MSQAVLPGDTAWVLTSTALVMVMTPGLALFYGGLVRRKNVLSVIMYCLVAYAVASLLWYIIGFTMVFGRDYSGIVGDLSHIFLRGLAGYWPGTHIPGYAFAAFQSVFAAIAIAIVSSAIAEKGRLDSWILYSALWLLLVYNIIGHWLWGGGWASKLGALDFAGGMVVHIASGFSALALALVVGRRNDTKGVEPVPHNLPLVLIGAGLLWFGWLGFNAGSALSAGYKASLALFNTNLAASTGGLAWMAATWLVDGRPSSIGFASGVIAGLVAVTPAAGYVEPWAALIIGGIAGLWSYYWVSFRIRYGLDETLDAWAVHGMSGVWGSLATGIFASPQLAGFKGLIYGGTGLFEAQAIATLASAAWSFTVGYLIAKLIDILLGWRIPPEAEQIGLDLAELGEQAYEQF